jgi:hypothetical protein
MRPPPFIQPPLQDLNRRRLVNHGALAFHPDT